MRRPSPPPDGLLALACCQEGLVSTTQCDAAGLTSARRASLRRAGAMLPVLRGVHDLAPALVRAHGAGVLTDGSAARGTPRTFAGPAGSHERTDALAGSAPGTDRPDRPERTPDHLRRRAAWTALLALGVDSAVAVGACALALHDVQGLPKRIRPEAALPAAAHREPRGGVVTRCFETGAVVVRRGARVVDVDLALAQAVCELPRHRAVAVLDSALQLSLLDAEGIARVRALARGRRGSARLSDWWDLVDGRAQSPLETFARLQCHDAGIPPHGLQVPVVDGRGRVVARGDAGWWRADGRLVVMEIDGAGPHGTPRALYADRARQNAVVEAGAVLVRFTAADIAAGNVAPTVARHLSAGGGAAPDGDRPDVPRTV